jgi:peptide/nickel transport system substrate-binding protein
MTRATPNQWTNKARNGLNDRSRCGEEREGGDVRSASVARSEENWTMTGTIWRLCRLANATIAGLVMLTGLAVAQGDSSVLKINLGSDLRIFDPLVTASGITRRAAWLNYDFLFAQDSQGVAHPQMVDTYTASDDGKTHTFTLRDGLEFHDGTPVTSTDVIASIQRWEKRDPLGKSIADITSDMKAVDDKTFVIELTEKYTKLPDAFAKMTPYLPIIVPARLAATDPTEQMPEVIGSGPYRFVPEEFVPGSKVVYEKFADYVPRSEPPDMLSGGKVVNFDRLEAINITDPQTAVAALQAGEIDVILNPQFDFIPILEADPNVTVEVTDKLGRLGTVRMNWLYPPFDEVEGRRAMQWLVNQKDFLDAVAGSPKYYAECGALYVCGGPWASEDNSEAVTGFDVDKAKELFAEAGYNGEKVVLLHVTDLAAENAAGLVLAQLMRQAGLNVEVQDMDFATFGSRAASREPPEEGGWSIYPITTAAMMVGDPMFITNSAACDDAYNGWPCDEEYEKLRAQFAAAETREEAKEIARKLQIRGSEIVLHVPYGVVYFPMAYRSDLEGLLAGPATEVFWNVRRK